ncbi:MAG: ComEC/Rec2 family competence protein [Elusimicrobia bacterium]|jgi:competence protein ComEC|nr:ComEC/Rec2 family competence protein [Elusimicrobiota bacterium]
MADIKEGSRKKAVVLTLIFAVFTVILIGFLFLNPRFSHFRQKLFSKTEVGKPYIKVTFLYVGQGDATLVRDLRPGGKVMLIDGGPSRWVTEFMSEGRESRNFAQSRIIPYLKSEGISKIDYLVGTHKDGDHIGGFPYIIKNFNVGRYYDNGTDHTTYITKDLFKALRNKPSVKFKTSKAGQTLPFGEDITCQFLGPLKLYKGTGRDENNSSVAIRIVAGEVSYLFTGDAEIHAELDMMGYGKDIKSTIMKVPHHGSTSSSSKPFLDIVKPEAAVVSCGRYNPYGFPNFEIIRRYENRKARVYRTDLKGNIEILSDGKNYRVTTER